MRPSFYPRLINPPLGDPGVYIPFAFEKRAILFDAGDLSPLSNRDILHTDAVFISHTHMDHFSGFDRFLRICLGREKILHVFGPEHFLQHLEGKLSAYHWNLVENYENNFIIRAAEICAGHIRFREYACKNAFRPVSPDIVNVFDGCIYREPSFRVCAALLDHGIPCLAFSLQEDIHISIIKEKLAELKLAPGPWLRDFKHALHEKQPRDSLFTVPDAHHPRTFSLGKLSDEIARISPGQKITYITDALFSPENRKKILALAENSDYLFIEAAFLDSERESASQKYHLTARQAGLLAARAAVRHFTVFHFSPRYSAMADLPEKEARAAYAGEIRGGET